MSRRDTHPPTTAPVAALEGTTRMNLDIPYLGLTGVAGAGKDTVFERLVALGGSRYERMSVADALKESVEALFGVSPRALEAWKRNNYVHVQVVDRMGEGLRDGYTVELVRLSMREFLQRYGTEAHRNVFGLNFWLEEWERRARQRHWKKSPLTIVNTSVRFENEAEWILDNGGEVWHIDGPQDAGAGSHESEAKLPDHLITRTIDNAHRRSRVEPIDGDFVEVPDFDYLDDQIATLLHGGTLA